MICIILSGQYIYKCTVHSLVKGKRIVEGYSLIEIEIVILFKIKAWIDLKQRKEAGEQIDSKNVKKHRNDIFRLLVNINPFSRLETMGEFKENINDFIEMNSHHIIRAMSQCY